MNYNVQQESKIFNYFLGTGNYELLFLLEIYPFGLFLITIGEKYPIQRLIKTNKCLVTIQAMPFLR